MFQFPMMTTVAIQPVNLILVFTTVGHSGWLFCNTSLICHDAVNIFTNSSKENPFPA